MKRYFEFQDSKSYKFWQIDQEGAVCTVTYGKIGTAGQEKATTYGSEELALKELNKLVGEKTRKGYVEKIQASDKKVSKRLAVSYDEAEEGKTLVSKVEALLASPQAQEVESLVIGAWEEPHENNPSQALTLLAENCAKLPKLKELFVGDMDSEDCEISWIMQADYTAVLAAFPGLERLHVKGSTELVLCSGPLSHAGLKSLTIECGGLPSSIITQVAEANLPELEHLCLYLGVEDYGFDGSLETVLPFLEKGRFPKLKSLGLVDSEIQDEIATAMATASVLSQLESLDLSQGTLGDVGGAALLASDGVKGLKRLDLHHHYLSNEMVAKLKALPLVVDVTEQQEEDDDCRYPAVTE
jgi:predicted DNA-binding WGR domain protein